MKNALLLTCMFIGFLNLPAQTPYIDFGITFGGSQNDQVNGLISDYSNNFYTVGKFSSTPADFDPGLGQSNVNANGFTDAFVAKYNESGEHVWSFGIGSNANTEFTDIEFAQNGVTAVGYFTDNTDFNPSSDSNFHTTQGGRDAVVVNYSDDGDYVSSFSFGGSGNDFISALARDNSNNIYVCGTFSGTVDFDPDPVGEYLVAANYVDGFVAKYNVVGDLQWAFALGSASTDECFDISVSSNGSVAVTGYIFDATDFDPGIGNTTLTPVGYQDIFVAVYDSNGALSWAHVLGSDGSQEYGKSVTIDTENNVYLLGEYTGLVDFDPSPNILQKAPVSAHPDIFLAKFNYQGELAWVNSMGGVGNDYASVVRYYGEDQVVIAGQYNSQEASFDPNDPSNTLPTAVNKNAYVALYDELGNHQFSGATIGDLESTYSSITFNQNGRFALGGGIGGIQDVDPTEEQLMLSSSGAGMSACIISFFQDCTVNPTVSESNGMLVVDYTDGDTYTWWECDVSDGIVGYGTTFTPDEDGLYAVEISYENCVAISNCYYFLVSEIDDLDLSELTISPNPCSKVLHINRTNPSGKDKLELRNTRGQVLWSSATSDSELSLDVSSFAEGLYILTIQNRDRVKAHKIIIE